MVQGKIYAALPKINRMEETKMKQFFALLLSVLMLLALVGCGTEEATPTEPHDHSAHTQSGTAEAPSSDAAQEHDHNHVNYKGLNSKSYTLEDVIAAEGAEPAFSFDANNVTYYVYNNVSANDLRFTQVQYSFMGDYNRISCTSSGNADPQSVYMEWSNAMTQLYGAALVSDTGLIRWADHTGNYVTLTILNEDTVQLCFYFTA